MHSVTALVQRYLVFKLVVFPSCTMGKQFVHVDATERHLINGMVKAGVTCGKALSITGAPIKVSAGEAKKVVKVAEAMVKKANANREVTPDMILSKARCDVDAKTVLKHVMQLKVSFFTLKEKPLEPGDVRA